MEGDSVMKRVVLLCAVALFVTIGLGGSTAWAQCGTPTPIGHQLDSYFLCDDSVPVQAFIYEVGAPKTDNSDSMRVACRAQNSSDPGVGVICSQVGSGVANDGHVTIETDAFVNQWVGCPAPPGQVPHRIAVVVVDGQGKSLILSVSGHDPGLAFQFEAAQPFDPATGAITPVACGANARLQVRNVSTAGNTATLSLHQDKPPVYTDCDPGSLGLALGAACDDNFDKTITLGHVYAKVDTCPSAGSPTNSNLGGTGNSNVLCTGAGAPAACCSGPGTGTCTTLWLQTTVTPNATGDATLVANLPAPTSGQCLFVGGTSSFAQTLTSESLTGSTPIPPAGAASPKAESVAASKATGKIHVTWSTSSEINLAAFKLLTHKKSGLAELTSVAPTGAGGASHYSVDVAMGAFQGGKDVVVRALLNDGTFIDAAPVNF